MSRLAFVQSRRWFGLVVLMGLALYGCISPPPPPPPKVEEGGFPEPQQFVAQNGELVLDIYAQFAQVKVSGVTDDAGKPISEIWTRAYGTQPADPTDPLNEIPGPTLVFQPGDWLQLTLHNQMNEAANHWLKEADDNISANSQDDIKQHIPLDLNIPHNVNNTNLHVHGLHVDPKDDDATLIIMPEDDDPSRYPPELQRFVPDKDRWWEWEYGYRIPADHLPGTHWFHGHKHGATSTHVENGMAGTLVIRPDEDTDDIVPGLWNDDPNQTHDRVLIFQEIANFGIQQGSAESIARAPQVSITGTIVITHEASVNDTFTTQWPDIAVNGEHQPSLTLAPGQTERWRFIDAGANHRTASYLWVGALVLPDTIPLTLTQQLQAITDFESAKPYISVGPPPKKKFSEPFQVQIGAFPGSVKLVAIDGITLHEAIDINSERPVLLGPGNRADLYIQPNQDASGLYYVGKNFNIAPPQAVLAQHPNYGELFEDEAGFWRYQALTTMGGGTNVVNGTGTPYTTDFKPKQDFGNLSTDTYGLGANWNGFRQPWPAQVNIDGSISGTKTNTTPLIPLLTGKPDGVGVAATMLAGDQPVFPGVGWAPPSGGGGVVDSQVLFTVDITGEPVTDSPALPTDERLNQLSPTTTVPANTLLKRVDADGNLVPGIPAYVAPITDDDIAGRQVIVFDRSGINFKYVAVTHAATTTITNTTTLNQFWLNGRQFDLNDFVGNPNANTLIQTPVSPEVADPFTGDLLGTYTFNGAGNYSNQVTIGGQPVAFFTNPGYYLPVIQQGEYYTYDYEHVTTPPTYQQITGLEQPQQPMATTAEEWLIINNSAIFHPFHIHINPFLVTEVGQLNYDGTTWSIKTLKPDDPLGYVLNNWWDVIILPPQGYVKVRFWLNLPDQKPSNPGDPDSDFQITDNANIYGMWVYHCHILRHEDRGMMMVVSVKPKPEGHEH